MEVKQCNVCLTMNSAYSIICGTCGERLNNTQEKGLSSFENCEVAVYYVFIIEEAHLGMAEEQMYLRKTDDTYSFHLFYRDVVDVNSYQFTLAELEKISNGRLARMCAFDDLQELSLVGNIVGDYWVNPLVDLIPVENV